MVKKRTKIYKTKKNKKIKTLFFYQSSDRLNIKAYKYGIEKPNQTIIVYMRGGNNHPIHNGQMELTMEDFNDSWLNLAVKKFKCVVYASDYRGSKKSDGNDDIAGKDIKDIIGMLKWIQINYKNYKGIVLFAESMGVYKLLQILSRYTKYMESIPKIKAIVLQAGVYNLQHMKKFRPLLYNHWISDYKLSAAELSKRDNMINLNNISKIITKHKIKLMVCHGTEDSKADIMSMFDFVKSLNCTYDVCVFKDGTHALDKYQTQIYNKIVDIL